MMKTKSCMAALTAVFLCLPVFTLPAYAQSTEPTEEPLHPGGSRDGG